MKFDYIHEQNLANYLGYLMLYLPFILGLFQPTCRLEKDKFIASASNMEEDKASTPNSMGKDIDVGSLSQAERLKGDDIFLFA